MGFNTKKRTVSGHEDAVCRRMRAYFRELRGAAGEQQRAAEIAGLPIVQWKGRQLYAIRCRGQFGRGPHIVNVPESLLWALISLTRFDCAFHR